MFKRFLIIAALLVLPSVGHGVPTPAFDASVTTSGTASTFTVDLTTSGLNRFLLIEIGYDPTTSDPVTHVSYNGTTAIELSNLESADHGLYIYYVIDPTVGDNPVSVLASASIKAAIGVRSFTGVDMGTPICDSEGVTVNGTSGAVTVTSSVDNALVLGTASWEGSGVVTEDVSQTERYTITSSGGSPGTRTTQLGDEEEIVTAGDVEMSYTYSIGNPGVIHAVCIHPPLAGDTPTPTPTVSPTPTLTPTPNWQDYKRLVWTGDETLIAEGTLALWLMENNLDDKTGTYDLIEEATGLSAAYITPAPHKVYALAPDASDINTCVHTDGNITGTVQTLEFYWRYQTGATTNRWILDGDGGNLNCQIQTHLGQLFFCFGGNYAWYSSGVLTFDQDYHWGITFNGVNIEIFRDNVSKLDSAEGYQSVNKTWHLGNRNHNEASDNYLDRIRISSDIKTSFPTED